MNKLYREWFSNTQYWFANNKIIDEYLCDKYFKHIHKTKQLYEYKEIYSKETLISCILLLDQIPRHYKRLGYDIDVDEYSHEAIKFTNYVLSIYKDLRIDELSFVYLPYRHVKDVNKIHEIIKIFLRIYDNSNIIDRIKCKRYLSATLNNIYKHINAKYLDNTLHIKSWDSLNVNIFDKLSLNNSDIYLKCCDIDVYNNIYTEYSKLNPIYPDPKIIVSLSGGVDSIVALYILSKISKNVIAVHINYNNREESQDELDFVNYYCNYLGIRLVYRTITEITRDDCLSNGLRDLYEDITKKIRFHMYELLNDTNTYILLGHNKDDCFENIITNITNKNSYDNLSGMESIKIIDNIKFWRPMLNIAKKDIIHFANLNNIPYLCDSTPKWSVRGKIRDNLRPLLCNLKNNADITHGGDDSAIESFFTLKEHIKESNNIINDIIINKLIKSIKCINNVNNVLFGTFSIDDLYTFRYKSISKMFFTRLNINISSKTLSDFIEFINRFIITSKERKFVLNKNNIFMIKNSDDNLYKKIIIS